MKYVAEDKILGTSPLPHILKLQAKSAQVEGPKGNEEAAVKRYGSRREICMHVCMCCLLF